MLIEHNCEICGCQLPTLGDAQDVTIDFKTGDEVCYSKTFYVCKHCAFLWNGNFLTQEVLSHIRTESSYGE